MSASNDSRKGPVQVAPLVPVLLAVMAGIVVDRTAKPWETMVWVGIALALGAVGLAMLRNRVVGAIAILGLWGAVAGAWHHHRWSDLAGDDLARSLGETPRPAWVRGLLRETLGFRKPARGVDNDGVTRVVLDVKAVQTAQGWQDVSGRALVSIKGNRAEIKAGDAVEAAGLLSVVARPLNPGEFDYRGYLRAQGVRLRLTVDEPSGVWKIAEPSSQVFDPKRLALRTLGAVREWSKARLEASLDPSVAPLAAALVLGRREGVDEDVNDAFKRTGTTHLLAISGLHMQVLALGLGWALGLIGVDRKASRGLVLVATVAYALLVGLMPSVVRSAAMTVTYCASVYFDRHGGPANTLAMAGLVTLAWNPSDLFDVGCQLSFLAVATILWVGLPLADRASRGRRPDPLTAVERLFEPSWKRWGRKGRDGLVSMVVISTVVWLAALPLVALRFHLVAPIGVLLNLPLIPLTSAAILFCGSSLGVSTLSEPLGWPLGWIGGGLLKLTEGIVRGGERMPLGYTFVEEPSWVWTLGLYVLGSVLVALCKFVRDASARKLALVMFGVWMAAGLGLTVIPGQGGSPSAEVLAVGHGLAVIIKTGDGRAWLYDCGRLRDPSVGRRIVAPALWARGIARLDAVILSHADSDHYDGLPGLLDLVPVAEVLVPPGFAGPANPGTSELLDRVRSRGINVRTVVEGDSWSAGGTRFDVRHPNRAMDLDTSDNARSVVLDVSYQGRHLLLTGDLDGPGLAAMVARPVKGSIDVLLAPHHGGRSANPRWFYDWASPALVVASQRSPILGSRDALLDIHRPILRTWKSGAIRLIWTDAGIKAQGFLEHNGPTAEEAIGPK